MTCAHRRPRQLHPSKGSHNKKFPFPQLSGGEWRHDDRKRTGRNWNVKVCLNCFHHSNTLEIMKTFVPQTSMTFFYVSNDEWKVKRVGLKSKWMQTDRKFCDMEEGSQCHSKGQLSDKQRILICWHSLSLVFLANKTWPLQQRKRTQARPFFSTTVDNINFLTIYFSYFRFSATACKMK